MQHHRLKTTRINHWYFVLSALGNFLLVFSFIYLFQYFFSDNPAYQETHLLIFIPGILSGIALYVYATFKTYESKYYIKFDQNKFEYHLPGKNNHGFIHQSEIKDIDFHNFTLKIRTKDNHTKEISLDHLLYKDILRIKDWFQSFK
ncbi:MAG: hypothetical protein ACOC2E_01635 [Bacteroidota bacterium]